MSRRNSPRKKKTAAKVHRVTKRHHVEVELTHYARALDKLYTKIDMAKMIPQVVQKMRTEYHTNPHDFYLMVCEKYGQTPEKKFDTDLLVYGRTKHKKWNLKQDRDKERVGERKERELQIKVGQANEKIETKVIESTEKIETVVESTEKIETVVETNETIETKVENFTEKLDTNVEVASTEQVVYDEEKKEELVQAAESKPPEREILTQSPRRAKVIDRMYMPQASQQRSPRNEAGRREVDQRRSNEGSGTSSRTSPRAVSLQQPTIEYVHIYVGDICETMVLTGSGPNQETGFWVPARVLSINTEAEVMDLEVLQPVKYGLAKKADNVPYRYVRAPSQIIWQQ